MALIERDRYIGDEDEIQIWWVVNGVLKDFSSGYTFVAEVASQADPSTILFTKSTGMTGAAGSGTPSSGVPNLRIDWSVSGELNSLIVGKYVLQVVATKIADSSETTLQMLLNMKARLG